ncbi:MAG: pantetheine-phosphate adenylyltransferase [Deltaproteobacteria bacterium]|nr:pantetheine-phosphate adenylyltransferase [Deltaproteobacteria bacterium]
MKSGSSVAVYPGSFDPITYGHVDIVDRTLAIFPELIVGVANNPSKKGIFSVAERIELISESLKDRKGVRVESFEGLLVDFCKERGAAVIIRGLRALSDFEFEFQMAMMNQRMRPEGETVFMMTGPQYFYLSSSIIKEVVQFGGDVGGLVPEVVNERLKSYHGRKLSGR